MFRDSADSVMSTDEFPRFQLNQVSVQNDHGAVILSKHKFRLMASTYNQYYEEVIRQRLPHLPRSFRANLVKLKSWKLVRGHDGISLNS